MGDTAKNTKIICTVIILSLCLGQTAWADEISDLKVRITVLEQDGHLHCPPGHCRI